MAAGDAIGVGSIDGASSSATMSRSRCSSAHTSHSCCCRCRHYQEERNQRESAPPHGLNSRRRGHFEYSAACRAARWAVQVQTALEEHVQDVLQMSHLKSVVTRALRSKRSVAVFVA